VDLIFENKNKSGGDKSVEYGGDLIVETLFVPKIALLIVQYEVSRCHTRGTSFLFPETEVLLEEFFEPKETVLPHYSPYSLSGLAQQILCE
jgi:hypothetical protein